MSLDASEHEEWGNPYIFVSWALEQRVGNPRAKAVLLAIAPRCNKRGQCWPSRARIARETEQSVDTVDRMLKYLVEMGFISIEKRKRSDNENVATSSIITLLVDAERAVTELARNRTGTARRAPDSGDETGEGVAAASGYPPGENEGGVAASSAATVAASSAATVAATVRPHEESLKGSVEERDARDADLRFEEDWKEFLAAGPWTDAMDLPRAKQLLRELNVKDRQLAARMAARYRVACAGPPKAKPKDAAFWLKDEQFRVMAERAQQTAQSQGLKHPPIFVRRGTPPYDAWWRHDAKADRRYRPRSEGGLGMEPFHTFSSEHKADGFWRPTLFPPGGEGEAKGGQDARAPPDEGDGLELGRGYG